MSPFLEFIDLLLTKLDLGIVVWLLNLKVGLVAELDILLVHEVLGVIETKESVLWQLNIIKIDQLSVFVSDLDRIVTFHTFLTYTFCRIVCFGGIRF